MRTCLLSLSLLSASLFTQSALADVFSMPSGDTSLSFVKVGDAGNAADITGSGRVNYAYKMGTFDVTAAQYCQFLNAVAATDPYSLWNSNMGLVPSVATDTWGSITRSGSPGSYVYSVRPGRDNLPANYITWGSAARFANWLTNGQPTTGVENVSTTEAGSYNLNGATTDSALTAITRSSSAVYVIPTVDEWYKAAYYKGGNLNAGYWAYPTQSNSAPSNAFSSTGTNNANYYTTTYTDPVVGLTDVGVFAASPGPYGTFDMAGEIWTWNEAVFSATTRGVRGGSFARYTGGGAPLLYSGNSNYWFDAADSTDGSIGFRIAAVPEPATLGIVAVGALAVLRRPKTRPTASRSNA